MRYIWIVALALSVAMAPTMAFASTEEKLAALTGAVTAPGTEIGVERRREFIDAGVAYWQDFSSRIPRNSPTEAKWVEDEIASGAYDRISRSAGSPQYALKRLVEIAESCVESHGLLQRHVGGEKSDELYLWLKAVPCYEGNEVVEHLRRAGLSDGTYDGSFKMATFGMISKFITGHLANSVHAGH